MISDDTIREQLNNILDKTDFPQLGDAHKGKVRDSYSKDGKRVLITSDRVSAFDVVIGTVPYKGQVLNQMAGFWFENTRDIAPNHIIEIPDPNVLIAQECETLPLEFIIRGYITGVTSTSAWTNYEKGIELTRTTISWTGGKTPPLCQSGWLA